MFKKVKFMVFFSSFKPFYFCENYIVYFLFFKMIKLNSFNCFKFILFVYLNVDRISLWSYVYNRRGNTTDNTFYNKTSNL